MESRFVPIQNRTYHYAYKAQGGMRFGSLSAVSPRTSDQYQVVVSTDIRGLRYTTSFPTWVTPAVLMGPCQSYAERIDPLSAQPLYVCGIWPLNQRLSRLVQHSVIDSSLISKQPAPASYSCRPLHLKYHFNALSRGIPACGKVCFGTQRLLVP